MEALRTVRAAASAAAESEAPTVAVFGAALIAISGGRGIVAADMESGCTTQKAMRGSNFPVPHHYFVEAFDICVF
jgi:hypothetical protein